MMMDDKNDEGKISEKMDIGEGMKESGDPEKTVQENPSDEKLNDPDAIKNFLLSSWRRVLLEAVVVIGAVAVVFAFFSFNQNNSSGQTAVVVESETVETEETKETETVIQDLETEKIETESSQPETTLQVVEGEVVETENWKDTIFGEESSSLLPNISVTGMTSVQKDRTGFRETDFLQALSDFLDENHITGITKVNFEEEIQCSSDSAYAFRASLDGRSDKVLNVIFYPDYPGRYILTLQDAQEVTVEVQTQTQTEIQSQTMPSQEVQSQTTQQSSEENSDEATQSYDATTLSVVGIPDTLVNYISNQYELQYTLYDFLYRNGYGSVTAATVTDYEIDENSRQARIYFTLSDGSFVTGTYDKNSNSYSYR